MPKFNYKLTRTNKIALANTESQFRQAIIKSSNDIAPTTFSIEYDSKEIEKEMKYAGRLMRVLDNKIQRAPFKQISDRLNDIDEDADKCIHKTIKTLIRNLKWNSNIVTISSDDYNRINNKIRRVREAMYYLQKENIIRLTTDIHKVVINHNELFYGCLDDFIVEYNVIYKDKDIEKLLTDGGKIKIN